MEIISQYVFSSQFLRTGVDIFDLSWHEKGRGKGVPNSSNVSAVDRNLLFIFFDRENCVN